MVNVDTATAHIIYFHFKYFREGAPSLLNKPSNRQKQTKIKIKRTTLSSVLHPYCQSLVAGI